MATQQPPLVSVVMANFNGQAHLAHAMSSVLKQSVTDIELLFADDASTDASLSVAEQIARLDNRVRILPAPGNSNSGPAAARNRALDQARGRWIAIVDSDDILHPQRFARLIATAEDGNRDGVADDLIYFGEALPRNGQVLLESLPLTPPVDVTPGMMIDIPMLGYLKPILSRSVIGDLRYREDIRVGEDHDFYLRYLLEGGGLHLIRQSYYLYRRHRGSISHRQRPEDLAAMLRAQTDLVAQCPDIGTDLEARLDYRAATLRRSMQFETLVQDIKQRHWAAVLSTISARPALLALLLRAAREHWQNRIRRHQAAPNPAQMDVVLLADGQNQGTVPASALPLTIPRHPDEWSSAHWAKFVAALPQKINRVFAQGDPGRFAIGYIPVLNTAFLESENNSWPGNAKRVSADPFPPTTKRCAKPRKEKQVGNYETRAQQVTRPCSHTHLSTAKSAAKVP